MKVTDPVCKMTIEDKDAVAKSVYKNVTYYFCSNGCKANFDKNPEKYVTSEAKKEERPVKGSHCC
jgi:YHS domain-containing protein